MDEASYPEPTYTRAHTSRSPSRQVCDSYTGAPCVTGTIEKKVSYYNGIFRELHHIRHDYDNVYSIKEECTAVF